MVTEKEKVSEEEWPYIAWVPCLTGSLDLKMTRVGLSGNSFYWLNKKENKGLHLNFAIPDSKDSENRLVVISSSINWRDSPHRPNGQYRVILTGRCTGPGSESNASMQGRILIFPEQYAKEHPDLYAYYLKEIDELQTNSRSDSNRDRNLIEALANKVGLMNKIKSAQDEVVCVGFLLNEAGLVRLNYVDSPVDEENPLSDSKKSLIIRQAYYYLKYAFHYHKHHSEDADSLTRPVLNEGEASGGKLVNQLKLEVANVQAANTRTLESGRTLRSNGDTNSRGLLGYLNSLCLSLNQSGYLTDAKLETELKYISACERSISAQEDASRNALEHKKTLEQKILSSVMLIVSMASFILIMLINTFEFNKKKLPEIIDGVEYPLISTYAVYFLILMCVFGLSFIRKQLQSITHMPRFLMWVYRCDIKIKVAITLIPFIAYLIVRLLF